MRWIAKCFGFGFWGVSAALLGLFYLCYGRDSGRVLGVLAQRSSLLLTGTPHFDGMSGGFAANILLSLCAMAVATVLGGLLGSGMTSHTREIRGASIVLMNAMLFIGTSLAVVTGTSDVLSVAKTVIASDGSRYATAIYLYILLLFFVFCYPISVASRMLERYIRRNR